MKKCIVRRKRIRPINGDLRSLFIENRNLHSLPHLCRGVLVSATIGQTTFIACISRWCMDKFSLFFWKERMIYSSKYGAYFPDFSLVTHNQRRCFKDYETHVDPTRVKITFLNQISGLINNLLIEHDNNIDQCDGFYQSHPSGPDIFRGFIGNKKYFMKSNAIQENTSVILSLLKLNYGKKRKWKRANIGNTIFDYPIPKYVINSNKRSTRIVCGHIKKYKH